MTLFAKVPAEKCPGCGSKNIVGQWVKTMNKQGDLQENVWMWSCRKCGLIW